MAMIRKVVLRNFKRFPDVTFEVPGHLVLAGPNNTGKTTLLQAIAAWSLGLLEWRKLGTPHKVNAAYPWADLERLAFSAAALRSFDLLWHNRRTQQVMMEIGIQFDGQPDTFTLEFRFQASGLVNVRPRADVNATRLAQLALLETVFIPAIGGLVREEPMLADRVAIQARLAQARAGEVLRNLVVLVHAQQAEWAVLNATLKRMFGVEMSPPVRAAEITCEYRQAGTQEPAFDLASAGSGMLQVLLVLSLLLTHPGATLLIDEPDAHLHLILQKAIYGELRSVAATRGSQLIIATHSEQVIESVDPRELCLMYGTPRLVADTDERALLVRSLGVLTHGDLLHANGARGVLYTEDFTDADILEAFSRVIGDDDALKLMSTQLVKKRSKAAAPDGLGKVEPVRHWEMLKQVSDALPALELLDGDAGNNAPELVTGTAERMQRLRWSYCEIENYLLHPSALRRFLAAMLGKESPGIQPALDHLQQTMQASFMTNPNQPEELQLAYLQSQAVSKGLLPAIMQAAGLENYPKNEYFVLALHFDPDEVHPEVKYKLAQIKAAFGAGPMPPPYEEFQAHA